jgi:hypothetical protein
VGRDQLFNGFLASRRRDERRLAGLGGDHRHRRPGPGSGRPVESDRRYPDAARAVQLELFGLPLGRVIQQRPAGWQPYAGSVGLARPRQPRRRFADAHRRDGQHPNWSGLTQRTVPDRRLDRLYFGCDSCPDPHADSDASADAHSNPDTRADPVADANPDTNPHPDTDAGADPNAHSDADPNTHTDADANTHAGTGPDTNSDANANSNPDANSAGAAKALSAASANPDADAYTESDSADSRSAGTSSSPRSTGPACRSDRGSLYAGSCEPCRHSKVG